jgi:fumarate hydratase subunit beta
MDIYTPELLERGLAGMIGKGNRSERVINSMMSNDVVYFACVGGAGALLQDCIKSVEIIAYEDLGTEAIRKIEVKDFPAIVVIDTLGNNLYETERKKFANKLWI